MSLTRMTLVWPCRPLLAHDATGMDTTYACTMLTATAAANQISYCHFHLQEARHFQLLSLQMLQRRQQQQCQHLLHWWGLIAQDLHHHRVVLDYFRARRVRQEGLVVFLYWREWAHERMLERKAVVAYWNRLMVTVSVLLLSSTEVILMYQHSLYGVGCYWAWYMKSALSQSPVCGIGCMACRRQLITIRDVHVMQAFAAWLEHHEDIQWEKAAAHDAAKRTAHAMLAWKVAMALIHRKRVLTGAAIELNLQWCVRKGMDSWLRYTYYRHMGRVALHFRIRRLCCVVLREWLQVSSRVPCNNCQITTTSL